MTHIPPRDDFCVETARIVNFTLSPDGKWCLTLCSIDNLKILSHKQEPKALATQGLEAIDSFLCKYISCQKLRSDLCNSMREDFLNQLGEMNISEDMQHFISSMQTVIRLIIQRALDISQDNPDSILKVGDPTVRQWRNPVSEFMRRLLLLN